MNFDEAEAKFRELQTRVQRGEPISRANYEEEVARLAVLDERGVMWEINPRTGKWMYFDGTEWVVGRPPGRDQSTVMPISQAVPPPPPSGAAQKTTGSSVTAKKIAPGAVAAVVTPPVRAVAPAHTSQPPKPSSTVIPRLVPPPPPQQRTTPPGNSKPAVESFAPPPSSPESVLPYVVSTSPSRATPAPSPVQPKGAISPRILGQKPLIAPGRQWVPVAIGAVIFLVCLLGLVGLRFVVLPLFSPTPTRTATPTRPANTPLPPPVVLPSPTLLPPTAVPVTAKAKEDNLNVRATPSKTGKILAKLKKDSVQTLVARTEDNAWYQINVPNIPQPGWVSAEFMQIVTGDPKTLPVSGPPAPTPTATKKSVTASTPAPQVQPTPTIIGAPTATPAP